MVIVRDQLLLYILHGVSSVIIACVMATPLTRFCRYPESIPSYTTVPHWAYLNVTVGIQMTILRGSDE